MINMYKQSAIILIYVLIGIFVKKMNWLPDKIQSRLSFFLTKITIPCAIISSFVNNSIEVPIGNVPWLILSICLSFAILSGTGKVSGRIVCKDRSQRGIWEYMMMFSNNIYIGFPVIEHYFGREGLLYATLICIPCNALMFSYGLYLTSAGSAYRFTLKKIFNTSTLASLIALLLLYFPVSFPKAVTTIIFLVTAPLIQKCLMAVLL